MNLRKILSIIIIISITFGIIIIPNVRAEGENYTITYNATFGKFSNGTTTNVVKYNSNHEVIEGTYEEPVYNTGTDSSDFITWYSEYDAKNRVDISTVSEDKTVYAAYEKITWRWDYTGDEQVFSLPIKVGLQLKVWGAQGGSYTDRHGGYGGYATGLFDFDDNQNIYINIGGTTSDTSGGYNGGGTGGTNYNAKGGGGATHIAIASGLLSTLEDKKDSVAIVAGAGGGVDHYSRGSNGGHGGGYTGERSNGWDAGNSTATSEIMKNWRAYGGTQEAGGRRALAAENFTPTAAWGMFGLGGMAGAATNQHGGGGGAGWYGGGSGHYTGGVVFAGAGGSSYIANTVAGTRHTAMFSENDTALTSDEDSIKTMIAENASEDPIEDYAKLGNGYAKAELTRLNIRYINEFDGTDFTKDQYVGSLAQEFDITQRPGYEAHWYKGDEIWNFDDPVNFDTTLEVKYTPITYDIDTDTDGRPLEEGKTNPTEYTIESDDITFNNPIPADYYEFEGWSEDGGQTKKLTVIIPKGSTGDKAYKAYFRAIEYAIDYFLDGGTANNPDKYTVESDDINLNNPTKQGYEFLGWSGTDLTGDDNLNVLIVQGSHGDRTYTAYYSIIDYTIDYDLGEGALELGKTNPVEYTVESDDIILKNPIPNDPEYEFIGWSGTGLTGNENKTVKIPKGSIGDRTYTANYRIKEYTIEYDVGIGRLSTLNPDTYNYETPTFTLNNPTSPDDYHYFVGWTTDKETEEGLTKEYKIEQGTSGNIKLYAIFQTNPYTVIFRSDGNEVEKYIRRGEEPLGELPIVKKEGYIFKGWYVNGKKIDEYFNSRDDCDAEAVWEKIEEKHNLGPITGDDIMKWTATLSIAMVILFTTRRRTKKSKARGKRFK